MIPKNKNISILHPSITAKWGAVKMMIYLSNLLQNEWNNVTFYTFSYDKKLFSNEINFNIECSNKIWIAYKIRKSDFVIIWNSPMQFVWAISKMLFFSNAKIIRWHHHYPWYYGENTNFLILIKRYLEKLSLKYVDELVANSDYIKDSLKNIYFLSSKVLYPIVDNQFIRDATIKKKIDKPIIFTYGRWVQWKNIKQIFETYQYLKNKIPNLELIIWWVGEELGFYERKFKTDKKISFLWLLDTNSIISNLGKSSIFLFPSLIDSFWMVVLEAQVFWVPVIAFDKNWTKEIIINEKTGFLVKTSKEFNEKTFLLLNDFELINNFSKNSILLSDKFSETNFKKQLNSIFINQ